MLAVPIEINGRLLTVNGGECDVLDLEADVPAAGHAGGNEVFDDLLLAVDGDRPTGQGREINAVPRAIELQVHAVVDIAFPVQPDRKAELVEPFDGAVFEHSGPHPTLDVRAIALLEHHAINAGSHQEVGKNQPGRTGTDDTDRCPFDH